MVVANINQAATAVPVYQKNLQILAARVGEYFGAEYPARLQALFTNIDLGSMARNLAAAVAGVIGSIGTVTVYVVFLLLEQHSLDKKIAALCHELAEIFEAMSFLHHRSLEMSIR